MGNFSKYMVIFVITLGIAVVGFGFIGLMVFADNSAPGQFLYAFDLYLEELRTDLAEDGGLYSKTNLASDLALERVEEWMVTWDSGSLVSAHAQLKVARESWVLLLENNQREAQELMPLIMQRLDKMEEILTSRQNTPDSYPVGEELVTLLTEIENIRDIFTRGNGS